MNILFFLIFSGATGTNNNFDDSFHCFGLCCYYRKKFHYFMDRTQNFKKAERLFVKIGMLIDSIKNFGHNLLIQIAMPVRVSAREFKFIHPTILNELRGNISGLRD